MQNTMPRDREEIEIDLAALLRGIAGRWYLVLVSCLLGAALAFAGSFFLVTPTYASEVMFYVNNSALSVGDASFSLSSGDLSTSRKLVDSYIVILNTRQTLMDVIDYTGVGHTVPELKDMLSAEAVNGTEIFQVTVKGPDPVEAERIADAIAYILPKRISGIIEGASVKVADPAVLPTQAVSPDYPRNTILGAVLGFLLAVTVLALRTQLDVTIRSEEDIAQAVDIPVLAAVPDMNPGKRSAGDAAGNPVLLGPGIPFAASEAYRLLRTKLRYCFANDSGCRIIGISSALSGEGKSLTAVNLADALSRLGSRVLLMDCDLRRPSLAQKLFLPQEPGLSACLSGQCGPEALIRSWNPRKEGVRFDVIPAGPNPPNPVELLSSARMHRLLEHLAPDYDYILLDLPPAGVVSDALVVAKETEGILLVVRRDCCTRPALADTARQFAFVGSRILGIAYNGAAAEDTAYGQGAYAPEKE